MTAVDDLLTFDEAAHELKLSRTTLNRLVREGRIRPVRLSGIRRRYIERRELQAYAATREAA